MPVDLMSNSEFNQIMKGEKTAPLSPKPLQKVEKLADIAEAKPPSILPPAKTDVPAPQARAEHNDDPGLAEEKVPPAPPPRPSEELTKQQEQAKPEQQPKPEPPKVEAAKADAAKPAATPTPQSPDALEPKPVAPPKVEPKKVAAVAPKPKPVDPPKKPEPKFKPDEVAKLLDADRPKDPPPKPAPKQKSGDQAADPADKFDLSDISRIINKDMPQRKPATGEALEQVASLGAPTASAAKMSPSLWGQLDGIMQDQYRHCWNFIGMDGQEKYVPRNPCPIRPGRRFDRRAEAFEPTVRSQPARARRQRPARGAALQPDAHPGAVPALLRPVERPDRPLRS